MLCSLTQQRLLGIRTDGARRSRCNILAAVPVARILSAQLFVRRSDGRPHIGCDCDPRADGNRPARRLCAADRLPRLHGGLAPPPPAAPPPLPFPPPPPHPPAHRPPALGRR